MLGSLLGYWPEPPTSLEGGFAFKWGAFHSVKERIMQRMVKPPKITMKHSFICDKADHKLLERSHQTNPAALFYKMSLKPSIRTRCWQIFLDTCRSCESPLCLLNGYVNLIHGIFNGLLGAFWVAWVCPRTDA